MKHILFISHTARMSAGTSHSLILLVKYLRLEYKITILVPESGSLVEILHTQGIKCHIYTLRRKTIPGFIYFLLRTRPDLIYANNFSIQGYFALFAARLTIIPFIWHIREIGIFSPKPGEAAIYKRLRCSIRFAQALIANSTATANVLKPYVPNRNVSVVYNGVDLDKYNLDVNFGKQFICEKLNIPTDHLIIINIGRFTPDKNQIDVIEVAGRLLNVYSKITFCFLGDFRQIEYVESVKDRMRELNIVDNIRFAGFQDNIERYLAGSDILIHTARSEPQGRVLLEAMATKIPVIAYNDGGVAESVIDRETGILVPFGDIDCLTNALIELVNNPELRGIMGRKGRDRVELMFTSENTATQIEQIIKQVIGNKSE